MIKMNVKLEATYNVVTVTDDSTIEGNKNYDKITAILFKKI